MIWITDCFTLPAQKIQSFGSSLHFLSVSPVCFIILILVSIPYKLNVTGLEWRPQCCNALCRASITKPANTWAGTTACDSTQNIGVGEFWLRVSGQALNFKKFSITSSLPVYWEDHRIIPFRRVLGISLPPAQSRVHYEVRSGISGLHLAWSQKPPRMEQPVPLVCRHSKKVFPYNQPNLRRGFQDLCRSPFSITQLSFTDNAVCFPKISNPGLHKVETPPSSWPNFENHSSYQAFTYHLTDHPYCRGWITDLHNTLRDPQL